MHRFFKLKNALIKKKSLLNSKFAMKYIENSKTKILLTQSKENFKIKILT